MADEATIRSSLRIFKQSGDITIMDYDSRPAAFSADVTGTRGPTPGALNVTTAGVEVDLSALTTPGLCRIMNLDATNYVQVGIYDGSNFWEMVELLPGETYVFRLARTIGKGTGTSYTTGSLMLKANTATCVCIVEAFEK